MVKRIVTVRGGLAVEAEVSFGKDADTPNGPGEYWANVDGLYWINGGAPLSDRLMALIEEEDPYWQAGVTEQVNEQLAYEDYERRYFVDPGAFYQGRPFIEPRPWAIIRW